MRNFSGNGRTHFTGQGPTCVSARCGSRAGRTKPPPMGEVPPEGAERAVNQQPSQSRPAAVPAPPEGEPNTVHPVSPGRGRPACRPAAGPPPGVERAVNQQPSQSRPAAVPAPPEGEPNTVHPISPGRGRPVCRPACGFTVGGGAGRKPTALSVTACGRHRSFNNSLQISCTCLLTKRRKRGILALGNRECQHYQPGECQTPPHEPEETADTENS